jgi:dihydrofolate reductase
MSEVRVQSFGVSIDGFAAGPNQSLQNPLGERGLEMMNWIFATRAWAAMHGQQGGETGVDHRMVEKGFENVGAWILGRNMFGPVRGPWPDESWKGWWGDEPPYHVPVFVLTHHAREPIQMQGGTTFHFVTDGIESALAQARAAAGDKDVSIAGGASAVQQYLTAGLLDEIVVSLVPLFLGGGARLFDDLGEPKPRLRQVEAVEAPGVTHIRYARGEDR